MDEPDCSSLTGGDDEGDASEENPHADSHHEIENSHRQNDRPVDDRLPISVRTIMIESYVPDGDVFKLGDTTISIPDRLSPKNPN